MKNTVLFVVAISLLGCSVNDADHTTAGDRVLETIIDPTQFKSAALDPLTLNDLEIQNDRLWINFSANGCSGDTWKVKLITTHFVLESKPPQRELVLSLKNDEPCSAPISRDVTFDISNLQLEEGGDEMWLNIINTDRRIFYEY
jgi:hypothetical protein